MTRTHVRSTAPGDITDCLPGRPLRKNVQAATVLLALLGKLLLARLSRSFVVVKVLFSCWDLKIFCRCQGSVFCCGWGLQSIGFGGHPSHLVLSPTRISSARLVRESARLVLVLESQARISGARMPPLVVCENRPFHCKNLACESGVSVFICKSLGRSVNFVPLRNPNVLNFLTQGKPEKHTSSCHVGSQSSMGAWRFMVR